MVIGSATVSTYYSNAAANTVATSTTTVPTNTADAIITGNYAVVNTWAGLEDVYANSNVSYIDINADLTNTSTNTNNTPVDLGIRTNSVTINGNGHTVTMNNAGFTFGHNSNTGSTQMGAVNVPGVGQTLAAQPSGQQYFILTNGTFVQKNTYGAGTNDRYQWYVSDGGAGLIQSTADSGASGSGNGNNNNWTVFGNNITLNPSQTSTVYGSGQRLISNADGSVALSGNINATFLNEFVQAGAFAIANGA